MKDRLLSCTRQLPRLWVSIAAVSLIGGYELLRWLSGHQRAWYYGFLVDFLCLVIAAWATMTIRCPRCQLKLLWHAVSTFPLADFIFELLALTECPRCHYRCGTDP